MFDEEEQAFLVFFASKVKCDGEETAKHRIYAAYTKDFVTFSDTFLYVERERDVIDTTILRSNGKYYRISKDETDSRLILEEADSLRGDFKRIACPVFEKLKGVDGILVPGGFGTRGTEGKIESIRYAIDEKIPFLGICLGMQMMVIEFARNVLGYKDANSREMDEKTPHNVIDIMEEQKNISNMGGTMRLGAYECVLKQGSRVFNIYKKEHIQERHRHRYEFNNEFQQEFEKNGMMCVGRNPESDLVEIVEIPGLKWYVGTQYHPEYQSTVLKPHPLFMDFVKTAIENKK